MNPQDFVLLDNVGVLHAAVVMVPLALGVVGMLLVLLGAIVKFKWAQYRSVLLFLYLVMAGSALASVVLGEMALAALPAALPPPVEQLISSHQWWGEILWMLGAATAVSILFCMVQTEWFRATFSIVTLLTSIATAVWCLFVAASGLTLVYEHGLGVTPPRQTPAPPATPAAPPQTPAPESAPAPAPAAAPDPELQPPLDTVPGAGMPPQTPPPAAPPQAAPAAPAPAAPPAQQARRTARTSYLDSIGTFLKDTKRLLWP